MYTDTDLFQIEKMGISLETIENQINNFKTGFPFVDLVAPATPADGIRKYNEEEIEFLNEFYTAESQKHQLVKFVPASGAASRMFKHLFEFNEKYHGREEDLVVFEKDKGFNSVYHFIQNIQKFAFYHELKSVLEKSGYQLDKLLEEKQYQVIIDFLLSDKGLGYAALPKGLLAFHNYPDGARLAVEEHLVEGAHYARDHEGRVQIHFTVSPEHRSRFVESITRVKEKYEKRFGVTYEISFSEQKSSTDTIAVDRENEPFREKNGSLVFRPGGHGALIENLNDLLGDIVFVKNIDNIVPDRLKDTTYLYKNVIGGLLLQLQNQVFDYLKIIEKGEISEHQIHEMTEYATHELSLKLSDQFVKKTLKEQTDELFHLMNRPIRVCGMVKNEGEPGGGPFWLRNQKGEVSLQIVESAQINHEDPKQEKIFQAATHFNPVDLVCGVRDFKGNSFDLRKFVDPATGFIAVKSKDGKDLKAQELPGLWNGAMAEWITVFVETPIITFNPVKTINDLLRPQHQPE